MNSAHYLLIARIGYFGLLVLLMAWYSWLSPPTVLPTSLVLLLMVGPLMFALRGMLYARPYTNAWVSMLALIYLTHGVVEGYSDPGLQVLGLTEVVLSSMLWGGGMMFARTRSRELKATEQAEANEE